MDFLFLKFQMQIKIQHKDQQISSLFFLICNGFVNFQYIYIYIYIYIYYIKRERTS